MFDLTTVVPAGPGAVNSIMAVDWRPALVHLDAESLFFGPQTVGQLTLSAEDLDECAGSAEISIELTREDVDNLIAALQAIRAAAGEGSDE